MKRIISVILICAMALCFAACRNEVEFTPDNVVIDFTNDSANAVVIEKSEIVDKLWKMYIDAEYVINDEGFTTKECVSVTFNDIENEAFENASIFSDGAIWFYDDFSNCYMAQNSKEMYSVFLEYMNDDAAKIVEQ